MSDSNVCHVCKKPLKSGKCSGCNKIAKLCSCAGGFKTGGGRHNGPMTISGNMQKDDVPGT